MKLNSMEELLAFNALLDQCSGQVWIADPAGKTCDLTDRAVRLKGLLALAGEDGDSYEIYARKREDEMLLMGYLCARWERTA